MQAGDCVQVFGGPVVGITIEGKQQMKTLNVCAATLFALLFLLSLIGTLDLVEATVFTCAVSVPLYLMGLVLRWFLRGLVK